MNRNQTGGDATGGFPKGIAEHLSAQTRANHAGDRPNNAGRDTSHLANTHAIGGSTDANAGKRGLGLYKNPCSSS